MMLVNADALLKAESVDGEKILGRLTSILSVSTRETDFIGWYRTWEVMGVLFTEITAGEKNNVPHVLHAKIHKALHNQLGLQLASKIHLTIHPFFGESRHDRFSTVEESSIA